MTSGLHFLLAARQCEIGELEQLACTSELVEVICRLTHALQKERGISNVFLASKGTRFADQRLAQIAECDQFEAQVRERFDALDTDATRARHGARLFSRMAFVLHALDALPALRRRIEAHALSPQESTAAIARLVAGLLAVVFEAADSASDPAISKALVALFNFMQGKEFAGQERAHGGAAFAMGGADATQQQYWQHLIESQERCFQVFMDFTQPGLLVAWQASHSAAGRAELERLRRIGCAPCSPGTQGNAGPPQVSLPPSGGGLGAARSWERPHDPALSQTWYACCTQRIDAMRTVEERLATDLRHLCERTISQARAALHDQEQLLLQLPAQADTTAADALTHYGPQLERSILGMVQEQAQRLQAMGDELDTVRAALNERKVVERAKGLLMATRKLNEEDAFKMLRKTAMNQNRRLVDVAESVLAMAEYL